MENHTYATVRAVYRAGVLSLLDPLALPDGAQVHVDIRLSEQPGFTRYPTALIPARDLDLLTGIVAAGGDALADSEALHDPDWD